MTDYSEDYHHYEQWNPYDDPSPFHISTRLIEGCPVCGKRGVLRCDGCKVVHYCRRVHQYAHRKQHKSVCTKIKRAQEACDEEEAKLRAGPDGPSDWGDPLRDLHPGLYWGIHPMRPYMNARLTVVKLQTQVNTREAVQAALDNIMDMLHISRNDSLDLKNLAPGLFLRLGREQACYDFVKWWTWRVDQRDYDVRDLDAPYMSIRDADLFEAPDLFLERKWPLTVSLLAVMLIKIRLLVDLIAMQRVRLDAGPYVPQEILDLITAHVASPMVATNRDMLEREDFVPQIQELKFQIRKLYEAAQKRNQYVWLVMLRPGNHLTARPKYAGTGTIQEIQSELPHIYNAWSETPGAIGVIEEFQKGTGTS